MRLASIKLGGEEIAALVTPQGLVPVRAFKDLGQEFEDNLFSLIDKEQIDALKAWWETEGLPNINLWLKYVIPAEEVEYAPLYRHPRKIWGIGLNYVEHAADLQASTPKSEPASFMKPDTSIIGHGDYIEIPRQSNRTTAEAELGVIIKKRCYGIGEKEVMDYIAGYTTIIDMTAEDILMQNPRYLTRAKSFNTFFSFGPHFVTPDEVPDLYNLKVATVFNGKVHRENIIANMTFRPETLVAFHSQVMTLLPGDIISTGTPGAVVINDGDTVECRIAGFEPLVNPVKDLKVCE
ncbi:MAG: fumarylacetoacetate hydrolase family protein [Desulfitobacteriia bacterium]|jgi:2-keto-4-pentenoate hydratase/2-oxohepta-3-ene-1,7-dioic acid hydratase in catechol pathway